MWSEPRKEIHKTPVVLRYYLCIVCFFWGGRVNNCSYVYIYTYDDDVDDDDDDDDAELCFAT